MNNAIILSSVAVAVVGIYAVTQSDSTIEPQPIEVVESTVEVVDAPESTVEVVEVVEAPEATVEVVEAPEATVEAVEVVEAPEATVEAVEVVEGSNS